jgi:hypothetical protein
MQKLRSFLQLLRSFAKFCQAGKQFSARTPVICIVCQTGKQFSAVTPIIAKVFPARLTLQITGLTAQNRLFA